MKKFVLAPGLAALAMFLWGFLFWGAPPHLPYKALSRASDEATAGEALARIFPATGTYLVPSMNMDPAKHEEMMKNGPIAEVHFVKNGMPMTDPKQLIKGYLHEFGICLVLVFMLDAAAQTHRSFGRRVRFCGTIGLLIALYEFGYSVWWNHAIGWVTMQAFYDFVAFFIAGLVLGKILTPKPLASTPAS